MNFCFKSKSRAERGTFPRYSVEGRVFYIKPSFFVDFKEGVQSGVKGCVAGQLAVPRVRGALW